MKVNHPPANETLRTFNEKLLVINSEEEDESENRRDLYVLNLIKTRVVQVTCEYKS